VRARRLYALAGERAVPLSRVPWWVWVAGPVLLGAVLGLLLHFGATPNGTGYAPF